VKRTRKFLPRITAWLLFLACAASPLLAAEESAPDPTDSPTGMIFRWLNFVLVAGGIIYLVRKFLAPCFRGAAQAISQSIHEATDARAAAEKELREVEQSLASLGTEVEEMRRVAATEAAAEAERLRKLAQSEAEKIERAAQAEILAAERVGRQQLRAIAARLATERAAALLRARMSPAAEAELFRSFVGEMERIAP
jgi:F0F1-type ATP synthase membrane subunit b/b'